MDNWKSIGVRAEIYDSLKKLSEKYGAPLAKVTEWCIGSNIELLEEQADGENFEDIKASIRKIGSENNQPNNIKP